MAVAATNVGGGASESIGHELLLGFGFLLHVQKWQQSRWWVLTHFQVFHSHSIQGCNAEEKQDSVTRNIYSQQGGAHSTAGLAVGCGKKTGEEKLQADWLSKHALRESGHTRWNSLPSALDASRTGGSYQERSSVI